MGGIEHGKKRVQFDGTYQGLSEWALALEAVFNRPTEALENLVLRSRSLIVIDWSYNEEIHAAIKKFLPAG